MSNDRETVDTSKCLPGTESFNVSELILFFKIQRKTSQGGEGSVRPTQLKRPHALSAVSEKNGLLLLEARHEKSCKKRVTKHYLLPSYSPFFLL